MNFRLAGITATLVLAVLLNGCAPIDSIFPLYKSDDAVFDDRLLGSWQRVSTNSDDKDQRWIFTKSGQERFYDFKWGAVGMKGAFAAEARLVQLGDNLFIDFEGDDGAVATADQTDSIVPFPIISTHMLGRVWLDKDTLQIHFLSDDWVKEQVKAGALSLAHLDTNRGQILTAQTEDLRKFMQAHADDDKALSEEFKFTRVR
ncbi:MAG TPA: hypothetical protein VJW94_10395 [Candidatus Acidoferrum sp.]|nr:hypothetical protein [Candidatus Acidoferrum sp.]